MYLRDKKYSCVFPYTCTVFLRHVMMYTYRKTNRAIIDYLFVIRYTDDIQPMISVYEHLLLSLPSDSDQSETPKQEQLIVFMTTLCNWSIPSGDEGEVMTELVTLLRRMDDVTAPSSRAFECERALELLLLRQPPEFTRSQFLEITAAECVRDWLKQPEKYLVSGPAITNVLGKTR